MTLFQVSVGNSWKGAPPPAPALAKQESTFPKCFTVCSKASFTWPSSETSHFSASTSPPIDFKVFDAALFLSGFVPHMQTDAPAWTRPWAIPRPIPLLPPVIRATFPVRSNGWNDIIPSLYFVPYKALAVGKFSGRYIPIAELFKIMVRIGISSLTAVSMSNPTIPNP